MAQALRTCGREILFSACQWGLNDPAHWMRSVGANMYRSTGDINDSYESMMKIMVQQQSNFQGNGAGCFNDLDMLTVGMYGQGLVARPSKMTYDEYEMQFAFWCFVGAPLMMGADLTKVDEECRKLMQHKELIRINQDKECRPPIYFGHHKFHSTFNLYDVYEYCRLLENGEFAIGVFNLNDDAKTAVVPLARDGVPYACGKKVEMTEVVTGEYIGIKQGDFVVSLPKHGARVFRCKIVD